VKCVQLNIESIGELFFDERGDYRSAAAIEDRARDALIRLEQENARLTAQLAEREELIQDLAMSLTEAEPFIGYAMHVPLLKADVARALARFHAAEGAE
jgi:hypothetical protein